MVVRKSMQEEREYLPDVYPSVDQIERTLQYRIILFKMV